MAGQRVGPVDESLGLRLECPLDGDESVADMPSKAPASAKRVIRDEMRDGQPASDLGQAAKSGRISAAP